MSAFQRVPGLPGVPSEAQEGSHGPPGGLLSRSLSGAA